MNPDNTRAAATWLGRIGFWSAACSVLVGPWLFGAWETWWFWPLAIPILAGGVCFGLGMLLPAGGTEIAAPVSRPAGRLLKTAGWLWGSFLAYAAIRALASPVAMTAERSFLLFALPTLVWLQISGQWSRERIGLLRSMLIADFLLLGSYGIVNHLLFDSAHVMWVPGYVQYTAFHRATGSYFCPDHFAGAMELGAALAFGGLLDRDTSWGRKAAAAALLATSIAAVAMSKSRGGGLAIMVMLAATLIWGFSQWRAYERWCYRISAGAIAGIALIVFAGNAHSYMARLREHPLAQVIANSPPAQWPAALHSVFPHTDRGQMICAALRAWQSNRPWGIGPGMHQNLWPRFAASDDGNRASGIWPLQTNEGYHSYEVHSDWVQLLEEYGAVGTAIFLASALFFLAALLAAHRAESLSRRRRTAAPRHPGSQHILLAALLAATAMAFHSLGDFNLQMPATGWLLAAILAMPFAALRAREAGKAGRP